MDIVLSVDIRDTCIGSDSRLLKAVNGTAPRSGIYTADCREDTAVVVCFHLFGSDIVNCGLDHLVCLLSEREFSDYLLGCHGRILLILLAGIGLIRL